MSEKMSEKNRRVYNLLRVAFPYLNKECFDEKLEMFDDLMREVWHEGYEEGRKVTFDVIINSDHKEIKGLMKMSSFPSKPPKLIFTKGE